MRVVANDARRDMPRLPRPFSRSARPRPTSRTSTTPLSRKAWSRRLISIPARLALSFLLLILFTAVIGLVSVWRFNQLTAVTTEMNTRDVPEVITIGHIRTTLYQVHDLAREAVSARSDSDVTVALASLTSAMATLSQYQTSLKAFEPVDSSAPSTNDIKQLTSLDSGITSIQQDARQVIILVQAGQQTQAQALDQKTIEPLATTLLQMTSDLRSREQGEIAVAAAQAQDTSAVATRFILMLTVLSLLAAIVLAVMVTGSLTRPLRALLRATEALASDDLSAHAPVARADEIGQLALAWNTMSEHLRETIASLAAQRQETQAIIDTTADGMLVVDERQQIVNVNPAGARLCGRDARQMRGAVCRDIFGCASHLDGDLGCGGGACWMATHFADPGEAAAAQDQREMLLRLPDGERRWLEVSSAPLTTKEGERQLVVGLHDITLLKRIERLKSDFVAMVSHELRAPLTTVTGAIETLGLLDPVDESEAYSETLSILRQQSARLNAVIEEVLQTTRIEAGQIRLRLRRVDLLDMLNEAMDTARAEWQNSERRLTLHLEPGVEESPIVIADPDLLRLVLRNLLANANNYTPAGALVEIIVARDPELDAPDHLRVCVRDHGAGIPEGRRETVFERFIRGDTEAQRDTQRAHGYGLGLYLTRQILQAHDERIWIESPADGSGARFVFSLRLYNPMTPWDETFEAPRQGSRAMSRPRTLMRGERA